ncbi:hypothetical protein DPM19_10275 [Actinomadura craniellae]|uniref:DUF3558 domain-containing protein n=1 Tax=Actinomadura craniellae TaxID=2231787 RepID=A0A365H7P4_9ACTN|nr:hypothetical protein DPM19_10275 [Actinomadura craniellae]
MAGVAACALAGFIVLTGAQDREGGGGQVSASGSSAEAGAAGDRVVVPDTCTLISDDLSDRLVPGGDRTQGDAYQGGDSQNQCVWSNYTATKRRQLTVELRIVDGGATTAGQRFQTERQADESGKSLLDGQRVAARKAVDGVGDEGYAVYIVDEGRDNGEAIVNVRVRNVLVTIHFSGGGGKKPIGEGTAFDGALDALQEAVKGLNTAK